MSSIDNTREHAVVIADVLEKENIKQRARCAHDKRCRVKAFNALPVGGDDAAREIGGEIACRHEPMNSWIERAHFKGVELEHGSIERDNLGSWCPAVGYQNGKGCLGLGEAVGKGNAREGVGRAAICRVNELIAQGSAPTERLTRLDGYLLYITNGSQRNHR